MGNSNNGSKEPEEPIEGFGKLDPNNVSENGSNKVLGGSCDKCGRNVCEHQNNDDK